MNLSHSSQFTRRWMPSVVFSCAFPPRISFCITDNILKRNQQDLIRENSMVIFFFNLIISLKFLTSHSYLLKLSSQKTAGFGGNTVQPITALGLLSAPACGGADFISSCCFSSSCIWFLASHGRPIFDLHSRLHGMLPLSHTLLPPSHSSFLMRMYPCSIPVAAIRHHLKYIREKICSIPLGSALWLHIRIL